MSAEHLSEQMVRELCLAARRLCVLSRGEKDRALLAMAQALVDNTDQLKQANAVDMEAGHVSGMSAAMLDRLKLDDSAIAAMAQGLKEVAALPYPVGEITPACGAGPTAS